jgi:hypothetical protein
LHDDLHITLLPGPSLEQFLFSSLDGNYGDIYGSPRDARKSSFVTKKE